MPGIHKIAIRCLNSIKEPEKQKKPTKIKFNFWKDLKPRSIAVIPQTKPKAREKNLKE